jgi:hypothetical protein
MPVDPNRVQSIFLAAIEQPTPEARAAYLQGVLGDDDELKERVEALLKAHDEPGSFLQEPSEASAQQVAPPDPALMVQTV